MDDKRDIQKSNPLFRYFDKQTVRTSPFGANQSADRAYSRAERLVAALFLVTNHIEAREAIRVSVREEAVKMLGSILALRDEMRTDSQKVVLSRASIRHLISLVRVLAVGGFLSLQNTNTMIEGLDELGNFLSVSQSSPSSETFALSKDGPLDIDEKFVKDIVAVKDKMVVKDTPTMSDKISDRRSSNVREERIVSVLRAGGELGIRDIAFNLPEYSEKMIQRHLVTLVGSGRVRKTGLKRWSKYSIVI
ncbi:hypothetical protein HY971_02295 [Candidatus Kaiserbacteria bacterium]|nr:hypothetical protein [Candidatus Kaiserbacteria bacterium]